MHSFIKKEAANLQAFCCLISHPHHTYLCSAIYFDRIQCSRDHVTHNTVYTFDSFGLAGPMLVNNPEDYSLYSYTRNEIKNAVIVI